MRVPLPGCVVALMFVAVLSASGCADNGARPARELADASGEASTDAGITGDAPPTESASSCTTRCGPWATCCTAAEECVVDRCLAVCLGSRCGPDDTQCCGAEQICVAGACSTPGARCIDAADCALGEACDPLLRKCIPRPAGELCRVEPSGVFQPEVLWQWTEASADTVPLVIQLTDDNRDGEVDDLDSPDVVVAAYDRFESYTRPVVGGRLVALDGKTGHVLWQTSSAHGVCVKTNPAAADIDGDGHIEIVALVGASGACVHMRGSGGTDNQRLAAFDDRGALEWIAEPFSHPYGPMFSYTGGIEDSVSIADLDADGAPEIIVSWMVVDGHGRVRWHDIDLGRRTGNIHSIADLDGDGRLDLVQAEVAFRHDGNVLWRNTDFVYGDGGRSAIAHLVGGGDAPQVVVAGRQEWAVLDGLTGHALLGPISHAPSPGSAAGPVTVGDLDGDGRAEAVLSAGGRMFAIDPDLAPPHELWSVPLRAGGSDSLSPAVFDFDGDGRAEIVVQDDCSLRVLDGRTGVERFRDALTSNTAYQYPVVADVDDDGNADLVVTSSTRDGFCDAPSTRGVRVYHDRADGWVPTRRVWNEHGYHIDNITEAGRVPRVETRGSTTHNTWRLNRLPNPEDVTLAPDLRIRAITADASRCPTALTLHARLQNDGSWGVAEGVEVAFYAGAADSRGALLGVARTTAPLFPGAATTLSLEVPSPSLDTTGRFRFSAVADDDDAGEGQHRECDEANASEAAEVNCAPI